MRPRSTAAAARLVIRDALPDDALAIAGVHVRSWQAGYRGLFPDEFLDGLREEDRAQRYMLGTTDPEAPQTILALVDGVVVAFASLGPCRDEDASGAGEVYALYVDPQCWSAGLGRRLMGEACERLRSHGQTEGVLWVLDGNERAARFYRSLGWRPDGATRLEDPWGIEARVHRYRRSLG